MKCCGNRHFDYRVLFTPFCVKTPSAGCRHRTCVCPCPKDFPISTLTSTARVRANKTKMRACVFYNISWHRFITRCEIVTYVIVKERTRHVFLFNEYTIGIICPYYWTLLNTKHEMNLCNSTCVCTIVADVHKPAVAHRDLSSFNVLVRADGSCALCDFGCSTILRSCSGPWVMRQATNTKVSQFKSNNLCE